MRNYVLVENRQIIHLGPIPWRYRFFQSELDDLEVEYTLPSEEIGYIQINENFEMFPVGETQGPPIDDRWEDPIGPTWEFIDNVAIPTFDKRDKPVEQIQQYIKNDVASKRYLKESAGTTVELRTDVNVTIDTSRDGRAIFVQVYSTMSDGATVNWKFPEGWYSVTKEELGSLIMQGFTYIQSQFEWERTYVERIEAETDISNLISIFEELNPKPSFPFNPPQPQ